MKILAGIPTRLRSTSGKIADVLASCCDEVIIVSQGSTCTSIQPNITIFEKDVNFGLVPARNFILEYAIIHKFDYIIQSDDDLAFHPTLIHKLIEVIQNYPTLGALASKSRAYFNWSKETTCTCPFLLAPCFPQLWIARTDILKEIGFWLLPYLEDREYSARMWKAGYAVADLHVSIEFTHNPFMSRNTDSNKQGGQEEDKGRTGLMKAIETMQAWHGDIMDIKPIKAEHRKFMTRYNWSKLLNFVSDRFGYVLKYEDSKGRIL